MRVDDTQCILWVGPTPGAGRGALVSHAAHAWRSGRLYLYMITKQDFMGTGTFLGERFREISPSSSVSSKRKSSLFITSLYLGWRSWYETFTYHGGFTQERPP